MNKLAQYLNEHILGQIATGIATRRHFSTDLSPLEYTPEIIAYPKVTNDIRKIARFAWQLAEKGHVLGITVRGSGTDKTGASIGDGLVIATTGYMDNLFELDSKQKMIRAQPGATVKSINDALGVYGLSVPPFVGIMARSTIGGAVANNKRGMLSGKYGDTSKWTQQLEVVLSNGDVLQTERISRRDLSKKKGMSSFEGEIYRQIDGLITDNQQLIDVKIASDDADHAGYSAIAKVKQKDGSFDLTPLLVGSQGTLGIISEMILKADYLSHHQDVVVATLESLDAVRDAIDSLKKLKPAILDFYDGALFKSAAKNGKNYPVYNKAVVGDSDGVVLLVSFDEFSERARGRKVKQSLKIFQRLNAATKFASGDDASDLLATRDVVTNLFVQQDELNSAPPLFDGVYIPIERLFSFTQSVADLGVKQRVELPLYGHLLENTYYTRPILQLGKISDKQKIFKLMDEYSKLVALNNGTFVADNGEGRLKALFAYRELDDDVLELYNKIKTVFDPHNILNPGVKQVTGIKELVPHLRSSYDIGRFADSIMSE